MSKQIYELKNQRAGLITEAETAVAKGDHSVYESKMSEVKKLNSEISALEMLEVEKGRFSDDDKQKVSLAESIQNQKEDEEKERSVTTIRSSKEYARAFLSAIRNNATLEDVGVYETYRPLQAALTEKGGTPEGSDGGFLVPIDVDNQIKELRRQMVSLIDLVQVENVSTSTGWRVKDTAPTTGFAKLDSELTPVPEDDQPKFAKVAYSLDTYGLFIPMSKELVNDEDANLMSYLAGWFARKGVITENTIILAELAKLTAVAAAAGKEVEELKKAINVTLDPEIALNAKWLTNQNGFNIIDNLVDGNKKPLLQPDFADATKHVISGYPVTRISNGQLPDETGKSPVYVGDFAQYLTYFRRQALEVDTTSVGGDAWRNYGYEMRGIMRADAQVFDEEAVAKLTLTETAGA